MVGLFTTLFATGLNTIQAQNTWTQRTDFGGGTRTAATGFNIGNKGYVGLGGRNGVSRKDFWEYDPGANTWTQKANFGGGPRAFATGFSIGEKGYIGIGISSLGYCGDFWEYDPVSNIWSQKADFGGGPRDIATGFSIGNKGYIGTGGAYGDSKDDFWEFDPSTNTWTQKADFGGGIRTTAIGFAINSKGYIGTGNNFGVLQNDFWEYDPTTNTWSQKADFAGVARSEAVGFSIADKGYIGTGLNSNVHYNDFWEYDPIANTWTQKTNFGGIGRFEDIGFSIGSKGYIGTGWDQAELKDFWEYSPDISNICDSCPLPQSVYISDITTSTAIVHWTGNSCAYSYKVRKRPLGTYNWIKSSVNAPATSKKIVNNIPNTTYEVQVQTYCDSLRTDSSGYTASVYFNSSGAQNTWTQKADFGGIARSYAAGFSIGSKGYVGTGSSNNPYTVYSDFWKYDPATDVWTQVADFGGTARDWAVGFSIGSKGYVGTGGNTYQQHIGTNDFWEYDPSANTWTQKAPVGGVARFAATGFSIGGKGYIGTGTDGYSYENDFWEFDPIANSWTKKGDILGTARFGAVGFSIGSKGYIGTGDHGVAKNDFWEYDPATDGWTQKADFGGTARSIAVGFSIGSKGYIGTGYNFDGSYHYYNDLWEYDPSGNTWTQRANFGGAARLGATGISVGNKGYIGTGSVVNGSYYNDFWEYTPVCNGLTVYADADGDGYGNASTSISAGDCIAPNGYAYNNTDCNDGNASIHPGAVDICNSIDDNCNGVIDESCGNTITTNAVSGSPFCPEEIINVSFTSTGTFVSGNVYTAQLSNYKGNFNTPTATDTFINTANSGTLTLSIPSKPKAGTKYRVRVISSIPAVTGTNNGSNLQVLTCAKVTALSVSSVSSASATLNWTGVSCTNKYKIQYRVQGTTHWTSVYSTTNSYTITGLTANTIYEYRIETYCSESGSANSGYTAIQTFTTTMRIGSGFAATKQMMNIYPNPAENGATIQFTLIQRSRVYIGVYELSGKAIVILLNDDMEQGEHSVLINTNQFSKGIYMVKMISDSGIENQKLIVQ